MEGFRLSQMIAIDNTTAADANAALQKLKKKEQVATKTLLNVSNS